MRRISADDPIKEFCNCENPKPENIMTVGGEKIAEQCRLCLRAFRGKCPKCAAWIKDVRAHMAAFHKKPPKKKVPREILTPLERLAVSGDE